MRTIQETQAELQFDFPAVSIAFGVPKSFRYEGGIHWPMWSHEFERPDSVRRANVDQAAIKVEFGIRPPDYRDTRPGMSRNGRTFRYLFDLSRWSNARSDQPLDNFVTDDDVAAMGLLLELDVLTKLGLNSSEVREEVRTLFVKARAEGLGFCGFMPIAHSFVTALFDTLEGSQIFEMMLRNNGNMGEPSCASHDFCDANMVMAAAFRHEGLHRLVDRELDSFTVALWNAAWDHARHRFLTC